MTNYDIKIFADASSNMKDFLFQIAKEVKEKRKVLFALVTNNDCSKYCHCDGRTKHTIRLLVYPYSYDRFIRSIVSDYIENNKAKLMPHYVEKQIEYINSLEKGYVTDEMKEILIRKIEREQMKEFEKYLHHDFVVYIKSKTDEILEKEIDG